MGRIAAIIGVLCTVAAIFSIFWLVSRSKDRTEFLPPVPAADGLHVTVTNADVHSNFAVRYIRFSAASPLDASQAVALFYPQLANNGWEFTGSCDGSIVSSSSWHHLSKIGGGLYLTLTVYKLGDESEYFGALVTAPYWGKAYRPIR